MQLNIIDSVYKNILLIILAFLGFFFSLAWFFANKGSKYWQENWEKHVDLLEDDVIGPLYKTTLKYKKSNFDRINPMTAYKYSVGKINQLVSFSIVLLWLYIYIHQIFLVTQLKIFKGSVEYIFITFFSFLLFIMLVFCTKSSEHNGEENFSFTKREIDD